MKKVSKKTVSMIGIEPAMANMLKKGLAKDLKGWNIQVTNPESLNSESDVILIENFLPIEDCKKIIEKANSAGFPRILLLKQLGDVSTQVELLLRNYPNIVILESATIAYPNNPLTLALKEIRRTAQITLNKIFLKKELLDNEIQPLHPADFCKALASLCIRRKVPKNLELVGPKKITVRQLINWLTNANPELRLVPIPQKVMDSFIKNYLDIWSSKCVQYRDLEKALASQLPGKLLNAYPAKRQLRPTGIFWQQEINHLQN